MTQLADMPDAVDPAHQGKTLRRGSRAMITAAGSNAVEPLAALGASLMRADLGRSR